MYTEQSNWFCSIKYGLPISLLKCISESGVIYAVIHGAANVIVADKTGASDPYCVLFCDRRRVSHLSVQNIGENY